MGLNLYWANQCWQNGTKKKLLLWHEEETSRGARLKMESSWWHPTAWQCVLLYYIYCIDIPLHMKDCKKVWRIFDASLGLPNSKSINNSNMSIHLYAAWIMFSSSEDQEHQTGIIRNISMDRCCVWSKWITTGTPIPWCHCYRETVRKWLMIDMIRDSTLSRGSVFLWKQGGEERQGKPRVSCHLLSYSDGNRHHWIVMSSTKSVAINSIVLFFQPVEKLKLWLYP